MNPLSRAYWTAFLAYHVRGQAKYPYRPRESVEADQDRRVKAMATFAYRTVPYYRETMGRLHLNPEDFQSARDLEKLPILEPDLLQRDPSYFCSESNPTSYYYAAHTSGTTGQPRVIYLDPHYLILDAAYGMRQREVLLPLLGKTVGFRKTSVATPGGSSTNRQNLVEQSLFWPPGVRLRRQRLSVRDTFEENVRRINEFKPDVIHTYGSYVAGLFSHVRRSGKAFSAPKAVFYTADLLSEPARQLIETAFGVAVFSVYEASEAFNLAFECESHAGMHVNMDLCAVRIVDANGNTAREGERGEVLISNLVNRGTVLLNYRLGDVAALLPWKCACGRNLPLMSQVEGRVYEWIRLPTGEVMHRQAVSGLFGEDSGVLQWQMVQDAFDRMRLLLVATHSCARANIEERIKVRFAEVVGGQLKLQVTFVDEIPRTPGGKVKPFIPLASD